MLEERTFRFDGEKAVNTAYTLLESLDFVKRVREDRITTNQAPPNHPPITSTYISALLWENIRYAYDIFGTDGVPLGQVDFEAHARVDGSFPHYSSNPESYFMILHVGRATAQAPQKKEVPEPVPHQEPDNLVRLIKQLEAIK